MSSYTFYPKKYSITDLIIEIAELEILLNNISKLDESTESQNPTLAAEIKEVKRKIEAAKKALSIANKIKGEAGAKHRKSVMDTQTTLSKKLSMLRDQSDKIDNGGHIGKGEIQKKQHDVATAKDKKAARRKELAAERKAGRERAKQLSAERKQAKKDAVSKK